MQLLQDATCYSLAALVVVDPIVLETARPKTARQRCETANNGNLPVNEQTCSIMSMQHQPDLDRRRRRYPFIDYK